MATDTKRERVRDQLPPDLGLLLDALRGEFDAKMTSLKLWGIAMTLGGGTLGGLFGALFPRQAHGTVSALAAFLPFL